MRNLGKENTYIDGIALCQAYYRRLGGGIGCYDFASVLALHSHALLPNNMRERQEK